MFILSLSLKKKKVGCASVILSEVQYAYPLFPTKYVVSFVFSLVSENFCLDLLAF